MNGPERDDRSTGGPGVNSRRRGAALIAAGAEVGRGEDVRDQVVAFDVAVSVRDDGDADSLAGLTTLLEALRSAPPPSYGTLVNVISAVQYALILSDEALNGWSPPPGAVARMLVEALSGKEPMRRQADDLLWELVDRRLVAPWLGLRTATLATRVASPDLRAELEAQTRHLDVAPVAGGDEYPSGALAA
jgi:hypothetical protein